MISSLCSLLLFLAWCPSCIAPPPGPPPPTPAPPTPAPPPPTPAPPAPTPAPPTPAPPPPTPAPPAPTPAPPTPAPPPPTPAPPGPTPSPPTPAPPGPTPAPPPPTPAPPATPAPAGPTPATPAPPGSTPAPPTPAPAGPASPPGGFPLPPGGPSPPSTPSPPTPVPTPAPPPPFNAFGFFRLFPQQWSPRDRFGFQCLDDAIIVHGGRTSSGETSSMFYFSYSTQQWQELFVSGDVAPRMQHGFVGSAANVYYAFGGVSNGEPSRTITRINLQSFPNHIRAEQMPDYLLRPEARSRFAMVASSPNAAQFEFTVFGGVSSSSILSDVWRFIDSPDARSSNSWTSFAGLSPSPGSILGACCAFHSDSHQTFCFGGSNGNVDSSSVWAFRHGAWAWTEVATNGTAPSGRVDAQCVMTNNSRLLIYGGYSSETSMATNDPHMYILHLDVSNFQVTANWTNVSLVSPGSDAYATFAGGRFSGGMCFSKSYGIWLFGGRGSSCDLLNDMWQIDNVTYTATQFSPVRNYPTQRVYHTAVMVGARMIIAFGRNDASILNDVWALDMASVSHHNNTPDVTSTSDDDFSSHYDWTQLVTTNAPVGRYGTASANLGNVIYFYGGCLSLTDANSVSDDLLLLDLVTLTWSTIVPSGVNPSKLAFHTMVLLDSYLYIYGGTGSDGASTSASYVFVPAVQMWAHASPTNGIIPQARSKHSMVNINSSAAIILGGLTHGALMDRWIVTVNVIVSKGSANASATFTELNSTFSSGSVRSFIRDEASVAGYGRYYTVCGGSSGPDVAARDADACYTYDMVTGTNSVLGTPHSFSNFHGGTAVHFADQVVFFGGRLSVNTVQQLDKYLNLIQIFNLATICDADTEESSSCAHCAPGTLNPYCAIAPAGYYSEAPEQAATPCPAGHYSNTTGAQSHNFCILCSEGTYSSQNGSTSCTLCPPDKYCPLGAVTPLSAAKDTSFGLRSQFASFYQTESVPTTYYVPLIVFVLGCAGLFFAYLSAKYGREQLRIDYYIDEEAAETIKAVYAESLTAAAGLTEAAFYNALTHPSIDVVDLTYRDCVTLFREFDRNGMGVVDEKGLKLAIIELIIREKITPFPGSKAAITGVQREASSSSFWSVNISGLDKYSDSHRLGRMGDPIRMQRTTFGGVLTVISHLATLTVVVVLIMLFAYESTFETRSSLPVSVITHSLATDVVATVAIEGPPVADCLCDGQSYITLASTSGNYNELVTQNLTSCSYSDGKCILQWSCVNCNVTSTLDLLFVFAPTSYATSITGSFVTTAGISKWSGGIVPQYSTAQWKASAPTNTVYRGYTETLLSGVSLPVAFTSIRNSFDQRTFTTSGMFNRALETTDGHTVDATTFPRFFGVPVRIQMDISTTALLITRESKQTIAQLVTSILGALSGVAGVFIVLLQMYDRRRVEKGEKQEAEGRRRRATQVFELTPPPTKVCTERELLSGLLKFNIPYDLALEHLNLIRRLAQPEVSIGSDAQKAPLESA